MDWKIGLDGTFSDAMTKGNLCRLAMCWMGGLAALVAYGTMSAEPSTRRHFPLANAPQPRADETGPLTARWQEPGSHPATCAVRFDNLHVEARGIGTEKAVLIENLHVCFRHRPPANGEEEVKPPSHLAEFCGLFSLTRRQGVLSLGLFDRLTGGRDEWSVPVDLAGATEVRVYNLQWQICRGDETILRVECGHARFPRDPNNYVLSGGAAISTPGAVLVSERIALDLAGGRFVAQGAYALTRSGHARAGLRGAFAPDLKRLELDLQPNLIRGQIGSLLASLAQFGRGWVDAANASFQRCWVVAANWCGPSFASVYRYAQLACLVGGDWTALLRLPGGMSTLVPEARPGPRTDKIEAGEGAVNRRGVMPPLRTHRPGPGCRRERARAT